MLATENTSVGAKELKDSSMIKEYVDEMKKSILSIYPDIDEEELSKIISQETSKMVKEVPIVNFVNNYENTNKKTTLLKWYEWYKKNNPITTEHGVCYKRHDQSVNLSAKLLEYILQMRKYHKDKMFECKEKKDFEGEKYHNIRQKVFKIFANSYYGATGQPKSIFFNLFTALSITGKGQSLITNAIMSFEAFYSDNTEFEDLDDIIIYINRIKNEERVFKDTECLSKQITVERLAKRLLRKLRYKAKQKEYSDEVKKILSSLSKKDLNHIYYKNNLFEFCKQEKVFKFIVDIINKSPEFKDPNKVPEEIKGELDLLLNWIIEFVYYPHSEFNRIKKGKKLKRKCTVTIDTDSAMLNIEPWIEFLTANNDVWDYESISKDLVFKMVNVMAYILHNMIGLVHARYTADCNVPEDKRSIINMKNEFLMERMVLTKSKKAYASKLLLQEGKEVVPEKSLDIKGLTIKKANVNRNLSATMQNILKENILESKEINISRILKELSDLEKDIVDTLKEGSTKYFLPDKCNEPDSYKTPFQMQIIRGICAWNILYPDSEITYPAQVNMVKLNINSLMDLDKEKIGDDEIYDKIKTGIFDDENLSKYGFTILSVPKNVSKIDDWIIPFIDVDTMIFNSMTNFNKILESISVRTIPTAADELHYSNIIDF